MGHLQQKADRMEIIAILIPVTHDTPGLQ